MLNFILFYFNCKAHRYLSKGLNMRYIKTINVCMYVSDYTIYLGNFNSFAIASQNFQQSQKINWCVCFGRGYSNEKSLFLYIWLMWKWIYICFRYGNIFTSIVVTYRIHIYLRWIPQDISIQMNAAHPGTFSVCTFKRVQIFQR